MRDHQVLHSTKSEGNEAREFFKRVLRDSAVSLNACKAKNKDDIRIKWTIYKNLSLWFHNWEHDLVELGLAYRDLITNKVCIPEKQLTNTVNADETCLSLDGSTQNHGGRPEVILFDPRFPQVGKGTLQYPSVTM